MSDAAIIERLRAELGAKALDVTHPDVRRIFVRVAPEDIAATAAILRDRFDMAYLATISGVDLGTEFEIVYHFASPVTTVNVRTRIPRDAPRLPSICAAIPGAVFYERELQDMFGLVVEGLPDPRPLILSDDWPAGQHPLRKDWKHTRPAEIIPGGTS